ncbi:PREDICTED: uncharacterized protein LOC108684758 [Atta colombica]|nr:PREDICTED: uncharacterized protein LOC108684758 [Atta colombica]
MWQQKTTNIFRETTAGTTEAMNTTADKTIASTTEVMNAKTKTSVNMNMFQFGDTKMTADAAEATNAAAKSSTNMNVIRFEDTKTGAAGAIEATNTTAEAKAVANATKETNAAIKNFVGDISKGYIGTFQFGKAKTVASAAETTNATRNFTDINRFEGTKMAAGVTEEINPTKYFVDVHMIRRETELYRREKELAERELMLARKEIEMLRQALIDASRPQKICCCFEKMSLQNEECESVLVSRQDRRSCKQQRLQHKDQRH